MIYLDNNSTTACDPYVQEMMFPLYSKLIGNASSIHGVGREAKCHLVNSLKIIASYFHVKESEILLTSGATEALNILIQGFLKPGHIITSTLEHLAVLEPLQRLEKRGWQVTYLSPKHGLGAILPEQVEQAIRPDTTLIVLMAANNETGIKTDIESIAHIAFGREIAFLVDGVAQLGKDPIVLFKGISAICFSGHKIHGPPGIGFAIVRKQFPFESLILGGPQQNGKRGGTENLPAIVGLASAITRLDQTLNDAILRMEMLRNRLEEGLQEICPNLIVYGKNQKRVCNTTNICFPGVEGETLLIHLDLAGIGVSHGSACSSGGLLASRVLLNMGIDQKSSLSSLRFSLSRYTTVAEIEKTIETIANLLHVALA